MANIMTRALKSMSDGTFSKKAAVRKAMFRAALLKRFEWVVFYLGRGRWQSTLKSYYLRRHGAVIGKEFDLDKAVILRNPSGLTVGDYCGIGAFSLLTCAGGITIDDYVNISIGCRIISANHHVTPVGGAFVRDSGHDLAPVHLKRGCWIATNSIILPGVTVGEGAVVTGGSLVTRDVPDYAYVGGVPARFMMYRKGYKPPKQ